MGFGIPLTGVDILKLLEGMAAGTRLSHTKLDDILTGDHHARTTIADLSPIALANLVAAVCSKTEADGKITTHAGIADAHHAKPTFTELAGGEGYHASASTTWEDWDLSAIIPAGAVTALISMQQENTSIYDVGARRNGTALDRKMAAKAYVTQNWLTEVDANRVIEIYAEYCNNTKFNVLGYWS
ncbi:hypothetical protein ES703_28927 [subsurface metagenome]